jgi:acetyl esterase/lipase
LLGLLALVAIVVVAAKVMAPEDTGPIGSAAPTSAPPAGGDAFGVTTTSSPLPEGCETVTYTPPDATEALQGDLCRPEGAAARDTAVVLVHGGGGYGGERSDMRAWSEVYRHAGYATLSIDYLIFDETTRSPVYPEPEQDVKAAVQWLRSQAAPLGVQAEQIVVHGISAGARLGGQLEVTPDDPYYQDTQLWPEVSDAIDGFVGFYGYYSGMQFDEERYYGGPEDSTDPLVVGRWERADSIAIAAGAAAPTLLVHGAQDGLVHVDQTERFAAALEDAGVDVTTEIRAEEGHAFDLDEDGSLSAAGESLAPIVTDWVEQHVG